jgi:hypothetical protein
MRPSANAYEAVPCWAGWQSNAFLFLPRRPTRSSAFHSSQIPSCFTLLYHSADPKYSRFCILFGPHSTIFLSIIRERTRFIKSSRFLHSIDRESLIKVFLLLFALTTLCLGLDTRCRETNIHIFSLHRIDRVDTGERRSDWKSLLLGLTQSDRNYTRRVALQKVPSRIPTTRL